MSTIWVKVEEYDFDTTFSNNFIVIFIFFSVTNKVEEDYWNVNSL